MDVLAAKWIAARIKYNGRANKWLVRSACLCYFMEKRDFLYHFTKIFLSEAVRETILIENWVENKDFDPRYEEYAKFFMAMKIKYASKKVTADALLGELTECKNKVVENFNKRLGNHLKKEIIERGCTEEIADHLISSKGIFLDDAININALKNFRALEEEMYSKEKVV